MSFSSLAMYDFAHLRADWEEFYAQIYARAPFLPEGLIWGKGAYDWGGDVALSLTCGAPLRNQFAAHLHVIGALDFGVSETGFYYSEVLGAWPEKGTKLRVAVNDRGSQSGFHALMHWLEENFKGGEMEMRSSGAHVNSMAMVAAGEADICAIDAVSYRFAIEADARLAALPVLAKTAPSPALPLVTSHEEWVEPLRVAVAVAIENAPQALGLKSLVSLRLEDYLAVPNAAELYISADPDQ